MADNSYKSDPEPTLPHMPRVPGPTPDSLPEDEYNAVTQPGSIPQLPPEPPPASRPPGSRQPYGPAVPAPTPPTYQTSYENSPSYGSAPAYGTMPPYEGGVHDGMYPDQARPVRERERKRRIRRRRHGSEWAWVIVALALFGVTLVVSMSVFIILRSNHAATADSVGDMATVETTAVVIVPTIVANAAVPINSGGGPGNEPEINSSGVIIEPWDGRERFTVLLMGWDRRPGDSTSGAYRTDTMMLISLDPVTRTIGVLSIPRDLYVTVPGYSQYQRVNAAYVLGELTRPGYGPELAMQTVQLNLGIRVHDYVVADFNTFITVVDAIGGIDVDVPQTINDPEYPDMHYGYDPFYITAGRHHLDGATALKYARTRHGSSDFRRAERQQQVLMAIRERVTSLDNLPQLVFNAGTIWASVQEGVLTGLEFDQILRLGWYAKDIPLENIHTGVIDEAYISFYTTPEGWSVVIPNRYTIGQLMVDVFGPDYAE